MVFKWSCPNVFLFKRVFIHVALCFVTLHVHNLNTSMEICPSMHFYVCVSVSVCERGRETPCWPQMAILSLLLSSDQFHQPKSLLRTQDEQSAHSAQNDHNQKKSLPAQPNKSSCAEVGQNISNNKISSLHHIQKTNFPHMQYYIFTTRWLSNSSLCPVVCFLV